MTSQLGWAGQTVVGGGNADLSAGGLGDAVCVTYRYDPARSLRAGGTKLAMRDH